MTTAGGRSFEVGAKRVGENAPVFIIAEIGYNFNTEDEALASIDAAAECGVDAVKFQTFRAETIVSKLVDFPAEAGSSNQFDEFRRYEISEDLHRRLFDRARSRGVTPFSTPSFYDDVELLDRVGAEIHKVGSDDLTNLPYLDFVARRGKPVIFSTGMASMDEVAAAVEVFRRAGNERFAVLQCVSNYPIKDASLVNLRVIESYRKAFGIPVGFSDHTTGMAASLGAVALGACIIERHFAIDKNLPAPDAYFSADPAEMKALVSAIRELESALGDGVKRPTATEQNMRRDTRKGAVAARDLPEGHVLSKDDLIVKRPAHGIQPAHVGFALGRRVKKALKADEPVGWDALA